MNARDMMEIAFWVVWVLAWVMGFVYWRWPDEVIEAQRRFYACINWCMEPIDPRRERRNTRLMGALIVAADLLALVLRFRFGG